ncbi:MAG: deoxynucleoside kinase [Proteobacteria bacterium]|nr:deoxynucleoside kinase [Pseudomonadota bacterium]MCP4918975.1 deoxynucleoside kinase [Pseudomonadota bacterium]
MRRFLVIEGLIGVGKTTLCKLVRDEWDARLVLEPWAENPFLASFYDDPDRFALPTQLFYLANRFKQQQAIRQTDLFHDLVVADYLFEKDSLFAQQTLTGDELELYYQFAGLLGDTLAKPDLVLFLDAPTECILDRINRRAIESEQVIQPDYLDSLRDRYYALWEDYTAAPVRVLHTQDLDYVSNPEDQRAVLEMIRGWLENNEAPGLPASAAAEWEGQAELFGAKDTGA